MKRKKSYRLVITKLWVMKNDILWFLGGIILFCLFHVRECYGRHHASCPQNTRSFLRLTSVLFACTPVAIGAFATSVQAIKFVRLSRERYRFGDMGYGAAWGLAWVK